MLRYERYSSIVASPRIHDRSTLGCDMITAINDVLKKLELVAKTWMSVDTVKMFRDNAVKAGFTL